MPISRIFQAIPLSVNSSIQLDDYAAHHVARVLRAQVNDRLIIFNGEGGEYQSIITHIDRKKVTVAIQEFAQHDTESPLQLFLAQGVSRGEKMDFTVQKAVELGVKKIIPVITARCNVKLDKERSEKRLQHWGSIIVSACEQSGRNHIPDIIFPISFEKFLMTIDTKWKFVLAPTAEKKLSHYTIPMNEDVVVLIGPEGGLTENEIQQATAKGFLPIQLGRRTLRTETAAVAALSIFQYYLGDLD